MIQTLFRFSQQFQNVRQHFGTKAGHIPPPFHCDPHEPNMRAVQLLPPQKFKANTKPKETKPYPVSSISRAIPNKHI